MAAEAVIDLRAKDNTRSAFASVQASLQQLKAASNEAGAGLKKNLDVKDAARSMAAAIGMNAQAISDRIARFLTDSDEETQKLRESLAKLSEEEIRAQAALMAARSTDQVNLDRLIAQQTRLRKIVSERPEGEEAQVKVKEASVQLLETELQLFQLRKKISDENSAAEKENAQATAIFAKAQNASYRDRLTYEERFLGLRSRQGSILIEMRNAGNDQKKLNELKREYAQITENIIVLEDEQNRNAVAAGQIIAQGFEDAIMTGNKFREALRGIAQDLLRLFIRQQITAPLAAGLSDFFKGSTVFANLFKPKALGGPVQGSTPYLVGERGPEIFVPDGSGNIIPNHAAVGGGGGFAVNVNYSIAAGVTRSELVPILEQERKRLKAEIPDMVRRGGAYRAAFA